MRLLRSSPFFSRALPASLLVLATLLTTAPGLEARPPRQSGSPFVHLWQTDELGASPVNWRMLQHPNGLIYIANGFGVLEFDGATWRLIPMPDEGAARTLVVDRQGRVWAAGNGQVITLEPDASRTLRAVDQVGRVPAAERSSSVFVSSVATDDGVYLGGSRRIFLFRPDGRVTTWRTESNFSPLWEMDGQVHVTRDYATLLRLSPDGGTTEVAQQHGTAWPLARTFAARRTAGGVELLTNSGPHRWSGERDGRTVPLAGDRTFATTAARNAIFLPDGGAVFATVGGALVLNAKGELQQRLDSNSGLPVDTINGLGTDRDGGLWLALQNGVARVQLDTPFALHGKPQGLDSGPRRLTRWRDRLYVAYGSGVAWRDENSGQFVPVPGMSASASRPIVAQDRLLVSTSSGIREIGYDNSVRTVTRDNSLALIASQREPGWLFSGDSDGVWILAPSGALAGAEHPGWTVQGRLRDLPVNVVQLYDFSDGFVWVVGSQGDVWRIDFRAGIRLDAPCERFGPERGVPPARRRDHVQLFPLGERIFALSRGWLLAFDRAQDRFVSAADELGLSGADVYTLSDTGAIWVHTESPHSQFLRLTPPQSHPGGSAPAGSWRREVFPSSELHGLVFNSLFFDAPTETLWIAGQGNLVSMATDWWTQRRSPALQANIRRVTGKDGRVLHGGAGPVPLLRLASTEDALRIEFATPTFSPDFRGRTLTRFRTRVEGLDRDWSEWSQESYRDLTNLPYRTLTFRVQTMTQDGRTSEETALRFEVLPPWWLTGWSLGLAGLIGAGGVIGFVRLRTRALQRRADALEAVVTTRTAELAEKNHTLAQQNTELTRLRQLEAEEKIAARLAEEKARLEVLRYQLNPHFLFNALTSVCAQLPTALRGARSTIQQLTEFCQLTLFRPEHDGDPTLGEELRMLRAYLAIEATRWGDLLTTEIVCDASHESLAIPSLLLLPIVENALKYGRATSRGAVTIRLVVTRTGERLVITASNTGRWVEPTGRGSVPSLGIGLTNLRQRLARYYPGAHEFTTAAAQGWVHVTITIPAMPGPLPAEFSPRV